MKDVGTFIVESQSKPLVINAIKIEGIVNTKHEFLESITKPLLQAKTLGDVIIGSRNVGNQLQRLGIFKHVSITFDADPSTAKDCVDVIYKVEEAPRLFAKTGADFGTSDSSMNIAMLIRNVFGSAETLTVKSSYGIDNAPGMKKDQGRSFGFDGASGHLVSLSKPLDGNPDTTVEVAAFKSEKNHSNYMGFQETNQGISAVHHVTQDDYHYRVGAEAVWRENHSVRDNCSLTIRNDAGHSLKSSIFHEYTCDTRKDIVFPSQGYYFKFFQELSGLGGNVRFFKNELNTSFSSTIFHKILTNFSFRMGFLVPLSREEVFRPRVNDKFLLGGFNSLRGFQFAGVGPRDRGYAVGGDAYYGLGFHLLSPLPYLPRNHIRGMCFINSGCLVPIDPKNIQKNISDFIGNPSVSAGLGLVARFAGFRLELNYCLPLRITSTDSLKPGFQFGIGINLM